MANKTPPMYARGRYVLKMPWTTVPTKLYTCLAIRSFDDIYELGIDVYETYYLPMGLIDGQPYGSQVFSFTEEVAKKANIITIRSDDGEFIHVPDTYILSYPSMSDVKYSHMVLSHSLGALPDYLDLSFIKSQVANLIAHQLGVNPIVNEHRAAATENPTPVQHEALEVARLNAVTVTETDYARAQRLQGKVNLLQSEINTLIAILQANNLMPP